MARIYGLNGYLQGKQGNNVFSIQNGTQVVKAYNPQVSNPRTLAQQSQRAKFALAGKISACTPSAALVGMTGNAPRFRRARFVSLLSRAATSSESASGITAQVPFTSMIFAEGSVAKMSNLFTMEASRSGRIVTATVPAMAVDSSVPASYNELVFVGLFDGAGSPLDEIRVQVRSRTDAATFTFRENQASSAVVACWSAPFIASDRSAGLVAGFLSPNAGNDGLAVNSAIRVYTAGAEFGISSFANLVLVA